MSKDYSPEELEKTFLEHAEKYETEELERRRKWEEEYKTEFPYPMFNVSRAFHVMFRGLNELKNK